METVRQALRTTAQPYTRRDLLIETETRGDAEATVSVASVSDQDWYISRTHGIYHIPACAKDQGYALVMITSRGDAIDLGDNRRFPFTISARDIAEDLLQDLQEHGIFVCAGARPTSEELAQATERRSVYYQKLIAEGDIMWARGHSFREISDLHRRAAISLGVEREWAYVPMRTTECPACGEKVKTGVAICRHCHAILDHEKAAKHGLGGGGDLRHNPMIVKNVDTSTGSK
ncbi:MAG TPA: zinc ribbon domain-containing protein [Candidatus Acidoferrales bacterium]